MKAHRQKWFTQFSGEFLTKLAIKSSAPSHACHRAALLLFSNAKNNHIYKLYCHQR